MRRSILFAIAIVLGLRGPALAQSMASPAPMMSPPPISSGMGAIGGAPGTTSGAAESQATVRLVPENRSNESGIVTLSQTNEGVVVTIVTDTAPGAPQPAHIHKGSCANLDPAPAFPLTMVTKRTNSMHAVKGVSMTTLTGVTLAQLESGQYAVNVHKSVREAKTYVACGDITNANPTGASR